MMTEPQPSPSLGGGLATFIWGVWLGMGFHIGWGLISLIVWAASKALGQADMPPIR